MENEALPINLDLLKWARLKAGMSSTTVAELGKVKPLKATKDRPAISGAQRVESWEEGSLPLSWRQLESLAKVYRRPALTFFLAAPPVEEAKLADFRTVGDKPAGTDSPEFAAFMRRLDVLHEGIIELVEASKEEALPFLGSITPTTPVDQVVESIREVLRFTYAEQQDLANGDELLRTLRNKTQEAGIFVLIEGDLGSYHSRISPEEFRGIAVCHPKAPLIVINPNDARAARLFTFIHELTHLWLGDSAVSNTSGLLGVDQGKDVKETFCNLVAAEFLVPAHVCLEHFALNDPTDWQKTVSALAKQFKVSRAVVARRLHDLDRIGDADYWSYFRMLQEQWAGCKAKQKDTGSGPDKNVLDKFRLGEKLIRTVVGGATEGLISFQDASRILKVKVARFDAITR